MYQHVEHRPFPLEAQAFPLCRAIRRHRLCLPPARQPPPDLGCLSGQGGGAFVNQAHGLFIRLRDASGERLPLAFQLRKTGAQRGEYRVRLPLRFERPQLCQPRSHRFSG